mgnify:CR=1 FL=1
MPCRALEAFGLVRAFGMFAVMGRRWVLMPCRALEAFGRRTSQALLHNNKS